MFTYIIRDGDLKPNEQQLVTEGFLQHAQEHAAPPFKKDRLNCVAYDKSEVMVGALTADLLWDWLYIDELWVDEDQRGQGLGKKLLEQAEQYAISHQLAGIWLWTQSWQAEEFYRRLGYQEFTRFPNFPKGHSRIGFRKEIPETHETFSLRN